MLDVNNSDLKDTGIASLRNKTLILITDADITGWTSPTPVIENAASGNIGIEEAKVEGSVAEGVEIFKATATSDATGAITYALESSTDSVGVLGTDGSINVATGKSLDYETAQEYVFVVR